MHVLLVLGSVLLVCFGICWIFREIRTIEAYNLCSLKGPKGLPLFGSLVPLLWGWRGPMKVYTDWADRYGPLYKVKIGSTLVVVVSASIPFNLLFGRTGNKLNFRVRGNILSLAMGNKGIATSDGEVWFQHRRFTTKAFKELGVGRSWTGQVIMAEVGRLVERVNQKCGHQGFYDFAEDDLSISVFSILWEFVGGLASPISFDDLKIGRMLKGSRDQLKAAEQSGPFNYYTILQLLWLLMCNPLTLLPAYIRRILFVKGEMERIGGGGGGGQEDKTQPPPPISLAGLYYEQIDPVDDDPSSHINHKNLPVFLSDFVIAGVESLVSSIRWTLLYLATTDREVLERLRNELDTKLEGLSFNDILSGGGGELPYLEAVINESLRIRPPIHTIVHLVKEDLVVDGEFIPKETWILGNIWGIHHDVGVWKDPDTFRPERFLNSDLTRLNKDVVDLCFAFSSGPRRCLGEPLSRMELRGFVALLVSNFDLSVNPEKRKEFSLQPEVTLSLIPKGNFLRLSPRTPKSRPPPPLSL